MCVLREDEIVRPIDDFAYGEDFLFSSFLVFHLSCLLAHALVLVQDRLQNLQLLRPHLSARSISSHAPGRRTRIWSHVYSPEFLAWMQPASGRSLAKTMTHGHCNYRQLGRRTEVRVGEQMTLLCVTEVVRAADSVRLQSLYAIIVPDLAVLRPAGRP